LIPRDKKKKRRGVLQRVASPDSIYTWMGNYGDKKKRTDDAGQITARYDEMKTRS
jgi:hypothetical protein